MKELGEALKAIFDKIGVFLDLFDLSFFISGAVAVSAVCLGCQQTGHWPKEFPETWLLVTMMVLAVYVAGMLCFALGRWMRQFLESSAGQVERGQLLFRLVRMHGLAEQEPIKTYLESARQDPTNESVYAWALHNRIWASLRHDPSLAGSLAVLNRYWVMAATYDGLAVALMLTGGVLAWLSARHGLSCDPWPWIQTLLSIAAGYGAARVCRREAGRYTQHQLGELAATIAAAQKIKSVLLLT